MSLIWTSLRRERRVFALWIFCLSVAVTGLLVVDVFRHSLSETLRLQGRKILSADLSVSARRPIQEAEQIKIQQILPKDSTTSHVTEMLAMLTFETNGQIATRLSSVRFVDDPYPLAGDLVVEQNGVTKNLRGQDLGASPSAWLARDLATLLGVKQNDKIKIGQLEFVVSGWTEKDSTQSFRLGAMAPRVYVHRRHLTQTALIQEGSTFSDSLFWSWPTTDLTPELPPVKKKLEALLQDPGIQVTIPTDLEQGPFRVLSRLLDYLGLTGLVTLCLGWTGVFYLGRRWLSLERTTTGILKCLGLTVSQVRLLLLLKLTLILLAGVLTGGALAWSAAQALFPLVRESLPSEFQLVWSWYSGIVLLLIGPLAGGLMLLPLLNAVVRQDALTLVRGDSEPKPSLWDLSLTSVVTLALFAALTVVQARSWTVSGIFFGTLIGTVIVLAAVASGLHRFALRPYFKKKGAELGWLLHLTFALWLRRQGLLVLLITVTAMSGLLSQLVPHLEKTLVGELSAPPDFNRPALFLIDIQDEQLTDLSGLLSANKVGISESAPFIRSRILQVNGQEFERKQAGDWATREQEVEARFRNRGVNLTYRRELAAGDRVVAGKTWAELEQSGDVPEISVEQSYAERLGLKLGDILQFDIQGVEVQGKIANLRTVDWSRFEPNFFITFKPGVLDEAPKTWIMTVRRSEHRTPVETQSLIAKEFPNITSINVREALDNATELFLKLAAGLKIASWLCLGLGVFVSLMILVFQLASSRRDWHQLQILGLSPRELGLLQLLSHFGLVVVGLTFGTLLSAGVAWAISHFALKLSVRLDWVAAGYTLGLALVCTYLGAWWIGRRLNQRAAVARSL